MNKRITSLALVVVMVLSLLGTAVPALAAPTDPLVTFTFEADKTSAAPGEEITYTVSLQQKDTLTTFAFWLEFPEGLTYIPNSCKLSEEAVEQFGSTYTYDELTGTGVPQYYVQWFSGSGDDFTYTEKLELITFKCKVNADAAPGTECLMNFRLSDVEAGSTNDYNNVNDQTVVVPAAITVTAAPKPATDITLDREELTLTVGDAKTLVAAVTPSDTTDTVAWSSDKPGVATVDSTGKVTAVAPGVATITAKAGSVSATCTVKVSCAHTLETVPAKESNCTDKGWDEYQKCTLCGALFDMSGGSIAEIPYRALNDDHDFDMSEWGYKGDDGHAHVCTRNSAHHDTVEAHNFGSDDTCDICGYERTHVCANHLTKVEEKLADCTNPGNIEHYKCSCGKLYEDLTANVPLTEEDVNRGALGHDWIEATCTEAKTCDRCGETEGAALGHNWATEWSSNADSHWHACTRCDAKDGEGAHNPGAPATETTPQTCTDCGYVIESATGHVCANHLTKVDRVEADCTNPGNIEHYKCSGDTGCGKLYEDRTASVPLTEEQVKLNALGHDWEGEWSSNADNHWHACTRCDAKNDEDAHNPGAPATETTPQTCNDCGYVIDPATGHLCISHLEEVDKVDPTCTETGKKAHYKCSCGKLYWDDDAFDEITDTDELVIPALGHDFDTAWSSDATNHWHACTRCDAKAGEEAHNPGPAATETTPQTCTDCGYVLAPAIGHVCANHLTKVEAKPASCTEDGNIAYYECSCGQFYEDAGALTEITDHESVVIPALDHAWADTWSSDEHNHWHACKDCDAKTDEAAHTPDHPGGATFEYPVLCVECGYEMEAQLEEGTIRVELPFKLTVEKTGELDPGKEIFKFMAEEFGAPVEYELITSTLETNGAKTYDGIFIFTIMEGDADNLSEGFIFRQVKGDAEGWTYDETRFYAVPIYNENGDGVEFWNIYYLDEEGMPDEDNRPNGVSFTNSYNAKKPVEPSEPSKPSTPDNNNPQTGDNSNLALWIVLLIASGSATGITLFSKKRKMNAK